MSAPLRCGAHAALLALIACWGASYAAIKTALDTLTAPALVTARFGIAAVCLLPFAVGRSEGLRAAAPPGLVAGGALAAGYLLQAAGLRETSASMGGFIGGLIPVLVAAGAALAFGARLGARGAAGLGLGFLGLAVLLWPTGAGRGSDSPRGILLQVAATICFAGHVLLMSHFGARLPALAFSLWQILVVTAAGAGAAALDGGVGAGAEPALTLQLAALLGFLGVVATAIGLAGQSRVQPRVPPLHVALLFATQPLFAALVGWAALDERLGPRQLAGAALIVAAVVVTSFDRARRPRGAVSPCGRSTS
jgi:drug/metabolite transporter (DMT)-like permease